MIGQLVSVPELGEPELNRLALRAGRMPARRAVDEVVLSEPIAEAHAMLGHQTEALDWIEKAVRDDVCWGGEKVCVRERAR